MTISDQQMKTIHLDKITSSLTYIFVELNKSIKWVVDGIVEKIYMHTREKDI